VKINYLLNGKPPFGGAITNRAVQRFQEYELNYSLYYRSTWQTPSAKPSKKQFINIFYYRRVFVQNYCNFLAPNNKLTMQTTPEYSPEMNSTKIYGMLRHSGISV
jgi:hypothetical protein